MELRTGEWRPIYERLGGAGNSKPTFVLFWTKWCRASIRLMNHLTQYAEEHGQDVSESFDIFSGFEKTFPRG